MLQSEYGVSNFMACYHILLMICSSCEDPAVPKSLVQVLKPTKVLE